MKPIALSISQFADTVGVGVETVRFYQRKGLLDKPKNQDGIGRYGEAAVRQFRFIRRAQQAGFTLNEIGELLTLDSGQDHQRAQDMAKQRIAELDNKIAEMQRARDSLKRLARKCAEAGPERPCAILEAFDL